MDKKVENNNLYFLKTHPRLLLLFFIPFALFMIVLGDYALKNKVILPGFYQFENQEALKNLNRVKDAIKREIYHLEGLTGDWAVWDDTYEFVETLNPDYLSSNIEWESLEAISGVNLIYILKSDGFVIYGNAFKAGAGGDITIEEFNRSRFENDHIFMVEENNILSSIIHTKVGLMLVCARSIMLSDGKGPSRGTFIMGRFITAKMMNSIEAQTNLEITLTDLEANKNKFKNKTLISNIQTDGHHIRTEENRLTISGIINGVENTPLVLVEIEMGRQITEQGKKVAQFASWTVLFMGVLLLFFLMAAFLISIRYLKKQKKEIEIKLGQTKDQLSKAFHSKAVFMTISTLEDGRFINVNDTFLEEMGFTKEEVIGKTSLELSIFPDPGQRQFLVNSIKENGYLKDFDITLQTKEKKIIFASISSDLILLQEIPCILIVMTDITERKNLEEELKKAMFTANQMTADAEIKNYQLELEMGQRRHAEEVNQTLYNISNAVNATSNLDELYKSIHKILGTILNLSNFYIAVYSKEKDSLLFPYWVDEKDKTFENVPDISKKNSFTIDVIKSEKPLLIKKMDLLEGGEHHGKNYFGSPPQAWLGVPLKIKGDVIGVMVTQSYTDAKSFTKEDINIMMTVSDQVALAIEQKRSEQAIRISEKKHRSIIESIEDGYCETDMAGNILFFNDAMCKITGYSRRELLGKNYTVFLGEADQKEINVFRFFTDIPERKRSEFSYKLIQKNGSKLHIGALPSLIKDSEDQAIGYRSIVRDIESQKKYEENLLFLAYHDALTGLKNRKSFYENLDRCLKSAGRNNNKIAILYMDIDKFKKVNDTLGHEIGDELLREISQRLNNCMRQTDVISRIGGDEFVIIIDDPKHFNPEKAASKVLQALSQPYHLRGHEINYVSTSIGISIFPDDAEQIEDLVKKADQAMYGAKKGKNKFVFFGEYDS